MELDVVFISLCYACQTVQTVDVDHLIVGWDGHLWCVVRKEILLNSNCSWTPLRMKEKKEKKKIILMRCARVTRVTRVIRVVRVISLSVVCTVPKAIKMLSWRWFPCEQIFLCQFIHGFGSNDAFAEYGLPSVTLERYSFRWPL